MGAYLRDGGLFESGAYLLILCPGWALIRGRALIGEGHLKDYGNQACFHQIVL